MKKIILLVLFIGTLFLTQSCLMSGFNVMITTNKLTEPTNPDKIELYYTKIPPKEYDEIAYVFASNYTDLKKTAAKIGANAILQIRFNKGYDGIAVRWK